MSFPYQTALVTGASSGIGADFARQLAARGTAVTILARRAERLKELAEELTEAYSVQVDVLALDLSLPDDIAAAANRLRSTAEPIDLLVNCAGIGSSGLFGDVPIERELDQAGVNVLAPIALTHAALEQMRPRRHGGILNISSIVAALPMPKSAVYGATKSFLSSFSESLYMELKSTGVHVTTVQTGLVRTEFHEAAGLDTAGMPSLMWLKPEQVTTAALAAVAKGKPSVTPGRTYKGQLPTMRAMPRALLRAVVKRMYRV